MSILKRLLFLCLLASRLVCSAAASEATQGVEAGPDANAEDQKTHKNQTLAEYLGKTFVDRSEWKANAIDYKSLVQEGKISVDEAKELVTLHHTVTGSQQAQGKRIPLASEPAVVKEIETMHTNPNGPWKFSDIGFPFLIGQSGKVYAGRPYEYTGAHSGGLKQKNADGTETTISFNKKNFGIAFIGCFDETGCGDNLTEVTDEMIDSAAKVIAFYAHKDGFAINKTTVLPRSTFDIQRRGGETNFPYSPGNLIIARLDDLIERASTYKAELTASS